MPDSHQHDLTQLPRLGLRPDIRLIASDLDGTLVDDARQIHDELWPLIDELHARGIAFCPASGRQYHNLRRLFEDVADRLVFIAENGTWVIARDREISSDCLPLATARRAVRLVRGAPRAGAVLCGKRSAFVERQDPEFVDQARPYYTRLELVPDLLEVVDDVLKVAVYDFVSAEHEALPRLAELGQEAQLVVSGPHWLDVTAPGVNKGRALRAVQRALGISPEQTMAFGDFPNDLELLDAAAYSFAMANAHPLVRRRARWIAPTNNANGVVRAIRAVLDLG